MRIAIVDLHSLIPVVDARRRAVAVVSSRHGRHFMIWFHACRARGRKLKFLPRVIKEVVLGLPVDSLVV